MRQDITQEKVSLEPLWLDVLSSLSHLEAPKDATALHSADELILTYELWGRFWTEVGKVLDPLHRSMMRQLHDTSAGGVFSGGQLAPSALFEEFITVEFAVVVEMKREENKEKSR